MAQTSPDNCFRPKDKPTEASAPYGHKRLTCHEQLRILLHPEPAFLVSAT